MIVGVCADRRSSLPRTACNLDIEGRCAEFFAVLLQGSLRVTCRSSVGSRRFSRLAPFLTSKITLDLGHRALGLLRVFTSEVTSIALWFPRRFCDLPRAFTSEVTSARRIPAQVCVNTQDAESMICALFYFRGHYSSYANRIGLDFQDPLALEESCAYAILYSKDH